MAAVAGVALACTTSPAAAQSSGLESLIEQYSGTTIKGYIQPLADVLVANLSMGYTTSMAPMSKFSLGIEAVSMTAALDEKLRLYTASTPPGFQPTSYTAPTIFGGQATAVNHTSIPGLSYRGSDGLVDAEYFPSVAPQLRVGGFLGTEVVMRYMSSTLVPLLDEDDFPELTVMGFGVQHDLTRYVKLPIDLSIAVSLNSLKFGDIVNLSANAVGLNFGNSFGPLGVSFGVLSEGGTMNLTYTSTDPNASGSVDVDLDVERTMRFRGGASLSLGFLKVFGDAAFGDVKSYAAGFRLGF
jgi:hypothetical protein